MTDKVNGTKHTDR